MESLQLILGQLVSILDHRYRSWNFSNVMMKLACTIPGMGATATSRAIKNQAFFGNNFTLGLSAQYENATSHGSQKCSTTTRTTYVLHFKSF